jgi:hypothetical protein
MPQCHNSNDQSRMLMTIIKLYWKGLFWQYSWCGASWLIWICLPPRQFHGELLSPWQFHSRKARVSTKSFRKVVLHYVKNLVEEARHKQLNTLTLFLILWNQFFIEECWLMDFPKFLVADVVKSWFLFFPSDHSTLSQERFLLCALLVVMVDLWDINLVVKRLKSSLFHWLDFAGRFSFYFA